MTRQAGEKPQLGSVENTFLHVMKPDFVMKSTNMKSDQRRVYLPTLKTYFYFPGVLRGFESSLLALLELWECFDCFSSSQRVTVGLCDWMWRNTSAALWAS